MRVLFAILLTLAFTACGQQLVEFPNPKPDSGRDCPTCLVIKDMQPDTMMSDLIRIDMFVSDKSQPDKSQPDVSIPDTSSPDIQAPDLMLADQSKLDVQKPDTQKPDVMLADKAKPDMQIKPDLQVPDVQQPNACALLPIPLGAAGNFTILGGSTVTNTGLTSITGNLGVSPGTAVTGFPPGVVSGAIHSADPTSAQAMAALTTAYNNAQGQTLCPITVAGNLGGKTLAPGLYKSTSSLEISSGDLTLDAGGNPNAVWIFQMASSFTTTPGRKMILAGGAKASNIFWAVGSSATIGTTSVMYGIIMADQSITFNTGASLTGRALTRIGAITLDSNVIVQP